MSDNKKERLNKKLVEVIRDEGISAQVRLKKLKYLVSLGADVNARVDDKSVLSWAEALKEDELVLYLKEQGAKEWVLTEQDKKELGWQFWDERGILKSLDEIKKLIEKGAYLNSFNKKGDSNLFCSAAGQGNKEIVDFLLENGVDIDCVEKDRSTPLKVAIINWRGDMVSYLVNKGARIDIRDDIGMNAICWAAYQGWVQLVEVLLKKGANIEDKNKFGDTLLKIASDNNKVEVVEFLLKKGANIEAKNNQGDTALIGASYWGHKEVVKVLLESGADVYQENKCGNTALYYAKWFKKNEVVKLLREHKFKNSFLGKIFGKDK